MLRRINKALRVFFALNMCTLLIGCSTFRSSKKLSPDTVRPIDQASYNTNAFLACSKDALFYLGAKDEIFAFDFDGNNIKIGSVNFKDDKLVGFNDTETKAERYTELGGFGAGILYFDNKILYESTYYSVDGQTKEHLNVLDPTTNQFENIVEFDYYPSYFAAQKDTIAVAESMESNPNGTVYFYNLNGKERKVMDFDADVVRIVGEWDSFLVGCDGGSVYRVDLDTLEKEEILHDDVAYVYIYEDMYSYYEIANRDVAPKEYEIHAGIKDRKSDKERFSLEDLIIDYFDASYIYTTKLEEKARYQIYDWDGNMVKEIVLSDELGPSPNGSMPVALQYMDYSSIARVWNNQLIGYRYGNGGLEYFACDVDTGSCKFLEY